MIAACLLPFSQALRIFPAKWCLLASVSLFEIGSVICGCKLSPFIALSAARSDRDMCLLSAAHSINILIGGRALSGVGAAGIFNSSRFLVLRFFLWAKETNRRV